MTGKGLREDGIYELLYDLSRPEELRRAELVLRLSARKYKILIDAPGTVVAVAPRPAFNFRRFLYLTMLAGIPGLIYLLRYVQTKGEEKTFTLKTRP